MRPWWRRLAVYARAERRGFGALLLLTLITIGFEVLQPWPMKLIVDSVLAGTALPEYAVWLTHIPGAGTPIGLVAWLAVATVVLYLCGQSAMIVRGYVQAGISTRMQYRLGGDLFAHLQRLSGTFHSRHQVGDLSRRVVTDAMCVRDLVVLVIVPSIASTIRLIVLLCVMWRVDALLSVIALCVAPLIVILIRLFDEPMTRHSYAQQQVEGEMMAHAEQTLSSLVVIQAFGREDHHHASFAQLSERTLRASVKTVRAQLGFKTGVGAVSAIGTAVLIVLGGRHVTGGTLTVGELLVFFAYLAALYSPMETLAYTAQGFASASARARRALEILDADEMVRDRPGAHALPPVKGAIQFENVTFGYTPDRPILHDITLTITPGQTVALVGATGAGKSTLASLVPRFFDPSRGTVRLDGHDLRDVTLASIRAQVALVLQEPFLLPISVADNIAYGRPDATRADIEAAARAANAEGFIQQLPQGYDTVLAERGVTLSGGERQRLSIARALLKNAPLLILDEPTSALDAQTEALLLEALERLMAGRTTLIIAHRLSTIRRADVIVVLAHGRIVELGHHDDLLAHAGAYARLHQLSHGRALEGASGAIS